MAKQQPQIVIIGAGFGGIYAARELARAPVQVTVVDRHNHHLFQPMLYQVAGAALNPSDIASPIRRTLRRETHTEVILADVDRIDTDAKAIVLVDGGSIIYDYCIVAPGVETSYYGKDKEWAPLAPGLKTLEDALDIRQRVLLAFVTHSIS